MIDGPKQDLRGLALAMVAYALIFMLKLAMYLMTGVMVVLAEALHSFGDIVISGFLLLAARWSRKAGDEYASVSMRGAASSARASRRVRDDGRLWAADD